MITTLITVIEEPLSQTTPGCGRPRRGWAARSDRLCLVWFPQETSGEKTNNGIHYRLQLLYSNGESRFHSGFFFYFIFLWSSNKSCEGMIRHSKVRQLGKQTFHEVRSFISLFYLLNWIVQGQCIIRLITRFWCNYLQLYLQYIFYYYDYYHYYYSSKYLLSGQAYTAQDSKIKCSTSSFWTFLLFNSIE